MKDEFRSSDLNNRPVRPADAPQERAVDETPAPASSEPAGPTPPDGRLGGSRKAPTWVKVIIVMAAGLLTFQLVLGVLAVGLLSFGVASCTASCSDNPVGDSRAQASFIADRTATERDVVVFDALRGSIESLYSRSVSRAEWAKAEDEEPPAIGVTSEHLTVDELRERVVAGRWPDDRESEALSPQVWVRIAELSQDWLEETSGGRWEIVDFAYPFPNNGPIPWPATRDENSSCRTRLRCVQGEDEGLCACVEYYRWAREAYFACELDDYRTRRADREALCAAIAGDERLEGRSVLVDGGDIYIWELGQDDPLRNPEAFLALAGELIELTGDYSDVTLLAADAPVALSYYPLSSDYPNTHEVAFMTLRQAQQNLVTDGGYSFDFARGDVLLSGYRRKDEELTVEDLTGSLAPTPREDWRNPYRPPDEVCTFDEERLALVASSLGVSEEQLMVAAGIDESDYGDVTLEVWVMAPRGVFPETPEAFCASVNDMRDVLWDTIPLAADGRTYLYVHVFVVDEQTLRDAEGEAKTFAELRAVAEQDAQGIDVFTFEVALSAMPSASQWQEDDGPNPYDCTPSDVGGTVADTRAWRYDGG